MLPAHARLRRREDFTRTIRGGRRVGRGSLVVHLAVDNRSVTPRAGFIVSKAVGNAVIRNLVSRRLRHLVAGRLDDLPDGGSLVVRALPSAAGRQYQSLGNDLDEALRKLGVR